MQCRGLSSREVQCHLQGAPTEAEGAPPGLQAGLEPGRYIYHSLLRISVKLGRPLSSLQALVNDMRQDGLQPDSATYTPLMHACANAGDFAAAHAVLNQATAEGAQCILSISVAGQQCFHLMRVACPRLKESERSLMLAAIYQWRGGCSGWLRSIGIGMICERAGVAPNTFMYTHLLCSMHTDFDPDAAMDVYKEMQAQGVTADAVTYIRLFQARLLDLLNAEFVQIAGQVEKKCMIECKLSSRWTCQI